MKVKKIYETSTGCRITKVQDTFYVPVDCKLPCTGTILEGIQAGCIKLLSIEVEDLSYDEVLFFISEHMKLSKEEVIDMLDNLDAHFNEVLVDNIIVRAASELLYKQHEEYDIYSCDSAYCISSVNKSVVKWDLTRYNQEEVKRLSLFYTKEEAKMVANLIW